MNLLFDRVCCAVLCLSMAAFVKLYGFKQFTTAEYLLASVVCFYTSKFSFSSLHVIKVLMSWCFFMIETFLQRNKIKQLKVITYLMSTFRNPCHALVGIGERVYHHHLPRETTIEERSYNLQPSIHNISTQELKKKMFFSSCVGFSVEFPQETIMKRLESCGKCQDWASVVVYFVSCHQYHSHTCCMYMRWLTWLFVAITLSFVLFTGLIVYVLFPNKFNDTEQETMWEMCHVILNVAHFILVAFDISNLTSSALDKNDEALKNGMQFQGIGKDALKFVVLTIFGYLWIYFTPYFIVQHDFYIYIGLCVVAGRTTDLFITWVVGTDVGAENKLK